ncbi:MAG: UbiA family prenyltransferase [Bacteroidota bacterium]|nr:UbiA family prenyltransferase [Bacteroidota bacterium]
MSDIINLKHVFPISATKLHTWTAVKNTVTLLRFPFSLFLLPITLFSFVFIAPQISGITIALIVVWHVLVFPSSNGYNSYHDRDTGPVGGLASPPLPERNLLITCNIMDTVAIIISLAVSIQFAVFVSCYIIASRLYSNREIRLKKYPIIGFLIVFIFQGAWIFLANIYALAPHLITSVDSVLIAALASSFFIGALYPITQIYQHQADKADGVKSLSMLLGEKWTFIFTGVLFLLATLSIYFAFKLQNSPENFMLFNLVMLPSIAFFIYWAYKSFRDRVHINFRNTMIMLILSSSLINLYFILLLFK